MCREKFILQPHQIQIDVCQHYLDPTPKFADSVVIGSLLIQFMVKIYDHYYRE